MAGISLVQITLWLDLHSLCSKPVELSSLSTLVIFFNHFAVWKPIGHFLSFYFFNIWSILKSLFCVKHIQGRVRVKMNENVQGTSFFSFHFLSFSISFPKLTIFTILRLYMAYKMWKIPALTCEISSWRQVEKSPLSPCIILYVIGLESMKLQNEKKDCFESRKKDTKTSTKRHEWNGMTQNLIFSAMSLRKRHLFCTSSHHKSSTRGLSLEMIVLARARAQLLNMLCRSTHQSVPHGENV